ncbi:MAG: hypothetical protein JHD32_08615 [Sphingobium sp.]|nr:hypothetical protein [Sphingobium sp.]
MAEARAYRPANGSEGADFMSRWCGKCQHDDEGGCAIAADTMIYRSTDPEYPSEWRTDNIHGPRCTAFDAVDAFEQSFDPGAAIGLLL